jgi:hypothetical protein
VRRALPARLRTRRRLAEERELLEKAERELAKVRRRLED